MLLMSLKAFDRSRATLC